MNFWSFLKYLTTPTTSLLPFKIQNISFVVHASGISIELLITKIKLVECERVHHPYNVQYNSLNGHPLRLAYIEYLSPWQLYTISLIQSISRLVTTRICCTLLLVWQKRALFLPPRRARDKGIFDVRPSGLVKELSNVQFLSDFCQILYQQVFVEFENQCQSMILWNMYQRFILSKTGIIYFLHHSFQIIFEKFRLEASCIYIFLKFSCLFVESHILILNSLFKIIIIERGQHFGYSL